MSNLCEGEGFLYKGDSSQISTRNRGRPAASAAADMASSGPAIASEGQAQSSASAGIPNLADDANVLLVKAVTGGPKKGGIYMHRTQEAFYCVCPLHPNCIKTRTWKVGRG
eukprot:697166-Amphidinium_carterae.1